MCAQDIIEQIKCLPPTDRAAVAKFVVEQEDSWIPDEFKEAIKDAEAGAVWIWKRRCLRRHHRACREILLLGDLIDPKKNRYIKSHGCKTN
jgi:hypothetical protein